jgi:hypothetical protein
MHTELDQDKKFDEKFCSDPNYFEHVTRDTLSFFRLNAKLQPRRKMRTAEALQSQMQYDCSCHL